MFIFTHYSYYAAGLINLTHYGQNYAHAAIANIHPVSNKLI